MHIQKHTIASENQYEEVDRISNAYIFLLIIFFAGISPNGLAEMQTSGVTKSYRIWVKDSASVSWTKQ